MDTVVIGACIVDLISYTKRFPKPGETLIGSKFLKCFGGKAANQCIMAQRLESSTALIAKVGDDIFGHEFIEYLKLSKVFSDHVTTSKVSHTSMANICVTEEGQNTIINVFGAGMLLAPSDIQAAENLISKSKIMLCTYEVPKDTLIEALKTARKYGVLTVVNGAPASREHKEVYPLCDIFCVNETEVEEATGHSSKNINGIHKGIAQLLSMGCTLVIVTVGENGALFASKENPSPVHVPAKPVRPVDTTGAGDAFMGSLVYYLSHHSQLDLHEKIRKSCEIASISVQYAGTQTSFPYKKDLPSELFC